MASDSFLPDDINMTLYIQNHKKGVFCGFKRDYLAQNLTEMEEGFVICKRCLGIMREATVSQGEATCLACSTAPNPATGIQNSISKLGIKCPLLRDCRWKGELSEAEQHLKNCLSFLIECDLCEQVFRRGIRQRHDADLCPMRIVQCDHCHKNEMAMTLRPHFDICSECPISCPNNCGANFVRKQLTQHKSECELEKVTCPYTEYGCKAKSMLRMDLMAHKMEYIVSHTDMSLAQIDRQKIQIQRQRDLITELEWQGKTAKQLDSVEWEIKNFDIMPIQQAIHGPTFYVSSYKLGIYFIHQPKQSYHQGYPPVGEYSFFIRRIEGDLDSYLGEASVTNYKLIVVNKEDYTKSLYEEGAMNYPLKIGSKSQIYALSHDISTCLTAETSLFVRFYFETNLANKLNVRKN